MASYTFKIGAEHPSAAGIYIGRNNGHQLLRNTPAMDIFLSKSNPLNTTLRDDAKRTLYSVKTPFAFANKVTTLTKYTYDNTGHMDRDRIVARIEWHVFSDAEFEFEGQWYIAKMFLKKHSGGRSYSQHHFKGLDGRPYKWNRGSRTPSLIMNDGSETVIAEYHRRSLGILNSAHDPYLRVSPQGMHMLDLIVATFILVEEKKLDAETQRNNANAFMANTSMANTLMANTSMANASMTNASIVNTSIANTSMANTSMANTSMACAL